MCLRNAALRYTHVYCLFEVRKGGCVGGEPRDRECDMMPEIAFS